MTDQPISIAVLEAVAAREGTAVTDLPPLGTVVDLDALENVFESRFDGRIGQGYVSFEYCDYTVVVHSDGDVTIDR